MKKKRINAIENLLEWTVYVYMVAMVAVFPLFYNDGYFDILTAKSAFFRYSSIGTIAVVLLLIIIYLLEQSKGTVRKSFLQQRDWIQDPSNWFAIIFILAVVLSTVLSPYLPEAWKGATGRYLGAEAMLLCVFLYLVVARF